jgi:glycosyltransferase involved in cell wall biosynthesis
MPVRFFGPLSSHSGYGNAVKNFALAFSRSDVPTKFVLSSSSKKSTEDFIGELNNYGGKCDTDFYLHCPPYNRHKSRAKHKIAYFYWEADTLPNNWGRSLSKMNELWVPCNLVRDACRKAKFQGQIKVVPTPCDDWSTSKNAVLPADFSNKYVVSDDVYKFYSVFQWQNRKGYRELISSYYRTFTDRDNVLLVLKVNALNIPGHTKDMIKPDILAIKRRLNQKYYPPVYLMTDIIPTSSVRALHNSADCYVAPHHGEGWGMPIHDAMKAGNQIIATKFGGITEFLDDSSAHIIKHSLGPVTDMGWTPLYGKYQNWAYPSTRHLSALLRDVYENHNIYKNKADEAKKIAESMTIDAVSKIISKEIGDRK